MRALCLKLLESGWHWPDLIPNKTRSLLVRILRFSPLSPRAHRLILLLPLSHFVVECFSGAWRVLASHSKNSALKLSPPQRVIFPREIKWRDGPGLNAWFLGTVIPTAGQSLPFTTSFQNETAEGRALCSDRGEGQLG